MNSLNHTLQQTKPSRRNCYRSVPKARSLSLSRSAHALTRGVITALTLAASVLWALGDIKFKDWKGGDQIGLPDRDPNDKATSIEDFLRFSQSLDIGGFALDYPKTIRDLRSESRAERLRALAACGSSEDLRSIPLIVAQLYHDDDEVQIWAGVALDKLVSAYELRRRDPSRLERISLLPRRSDHIDLSPLRWVVVEMLYSGHSSLQAQAATMAGYIGLSDLEPILKAIHQSRHPATYNAVEHAFDLLHIKYDKRHE